MKAAPRRPDPLVVMLVLAFAVGLILRLINLNAESYWFDEAFSWDKSALPLPQLISALIADFVHPPLHYLFLHNWLAVSPLDDALTGRLLAAVFGVALLPALYWLGRQLYDHRTATIAVVLMAVSQLGVAYSQEVRPYSQLMLFTVLTTAFYVQAVERRSFAALLGAGLSAILAMGTHYYAAFVVFALGLWHLIYARDRFPLLWIAVVVAMGLLAYEPWLLSGVIDRALHSPKTLDPNQPPWFSATWETPLEDLAAFGNSREVAWTAASLRWPIVVATALFCAPALLVLRRRWERGLLAVLGVLALGVMGGAWKWIVLGFVLVAMRVVIDLMPDRRWRAWASVLFLACIVAATIFAHLRYGPLFFCFLLGLLAASPIRSWLPESQAADEDWPRLALLALLVAAPIVALDLAAVEGVQYATRYVLAALPPFYLLVAHALSRFRTPVQRYGWLAAILVFSGLGLWNHYRTPFKENYRDALGFLHAAYRPGECVAFVPFHRTPAQWRLYRYDDVGIRVMDEAAIAAAPQACPGAWLVMYQRVPNALARGRVVEKAFASSRPLLEARQYHWVRVVHFGPARGGAP